VAVLAATLMAPGARYAGPRSTGTGLGHPVDDVPASRLAAKDASLFAMTFECTDFLFVSTVVRLNTGGSVGHPAKTTGVAWRKSGNWR